MSIALLDGDILAFRAAAAAQTNSFDFGDGAKTDPFVDANEAAEAACQTVKAWAALARCKDVIVCFTGRENFRRSVLSTYKSNRKGKVKPLAYMATVDEVQKRFPWRLIEGLEADDAMGILATTLPKYADAVVVSLDKDMRTFPGMHLQPLKEDKPVRVTEAQADHYWMTQTLTGDTSDGYTGIPGIGAKKAAGILGPVGPSALALWPKVVAAYRKAGLTEHDALVQARVARILRRSDYDQATKEILLWSPHTPERIPLLPIMEPTA